MKRIAIIVILFFLVVLPVQSETILEYYETDLVNIRPSAFDLDNDKMTYFFDYPLTNEGTWQTAYGDEGIYHTKVTVSDGRLKTVEDITLVINKKEEQPEFTFSIPDKQDLFITEGKNIFFNVEAKDLNQDSLTFTWYFDEMEVGSGKFYTYESDFYSSGDHLVKVDVSDGTLVNSREWLVEVGNFDRLQLLVDFKSITLNETQSVIYRLPDFESFDLEYEISEPIGNDGIWQTTYEDSGFYTATLKVWDDKNFSVEKSLKFLVEDLDRPPLPLQTNSYWFSENDDIELSLNFIDEDGDEVDVFIKNQPEDAILDDNILYWKPGYNTVVPEGFVDNLARNYHLMSKVLTLQVEASSRRSTTFQDITLRIFNKNRAPEISNIENIVVQEGDLLNFNFTLNDVDNDELKITYDKFGQGYETKIGDAGTHFVKVTASDGFLSTEEYIRVRILPTNLAPRLEEINELNVNEDETLAISLSAFDINDDSLEFSTNSTEGRIIGNKFEYKPDFDSAGRMEISFTVSDGELTDTKTAIINIHDIKRPPVLLTSVQIDDKTFYVGENIEFFVDVYSPDSQINYEWQTGLFDRFSANESITVQFASKGSKKIVAVATDGSTTLRREWNINIIKAPKVNLAIIQ